MTQKNSRICNNYSGIASEGKYKAKIWKRLKILSPKQMLQRLSIALAQVKTVYTSEKLLDEIRKNIFSLYRGNGITK